MFIQCLEAAGVKALMSIVCLADVQDQRRLFREHPDIASLSPGRIGQRFLELRAMGFEDDGILNALLSAPVLFSWDATCVHPPSNT